MSHPASFEGSPLAAQNVLPPAGRADAELLLTSVGNWGYYATDNTDEFFVLRPDMGDTTNGIFKVWAAPVIAVLDTGDRHTTAAMERWSAELVNKPLSLLQSLEQWRAYAAVADKRLQRLFGERPVPADPATAMVELFGRLKVAFGMTAPFYDLEAMIADTREVPVNNPIDVTAEQEGGGRLDAVGMMLPAALKDRLVAVQADWRGLDWGQIDADVDKMRGEFLAGRQTREAQQYALLYKVASLAGIDPGDVLFAANVLEFIPSDVGGKSADLDMHEALSVLTDLLDRPMPNVSTSTVAKDMNALIRFLNWVPALRSDANFEGRFWNYAAACDTSSALFELVQKYPEEAFGAEFAAIFRTQLAPQLESIDASSARGRFMLQLLQEGRFRPEILASLAQFERPFKRWTLTALESMQREEAIVDLAATTPAYLVGGKSEGLRKAMRLFGESEVAGGKVLTTEAVTAWLHGIPSMAGVIKVLEASPDIANKVAAGQAAIELLQEATVPADILANIRSAFRADSRLVVRSSSYDEDVSIIGPAPGVYESVVDVQTGIELENALKETVASFFSEKAIAFRELLGLRHKPLFAVLIQELLQGPGGTVFVQNGRVTLNVAGSASAVNTLDGSAHKVVEEHVMRGDGYDALPASRLLSQTQLADLLWKAVSAGRVEGACDLEFAVDSRTGQVKLTQMRSLQRPESAERTVEIYGELTPVVINHLDALPDLPHNEVVNLTIGSGIDLDTFQGPLLRWIVTHRNSIGAVTVQHRIPATCHFANIIETLGIQLHIQEG